MFSRPFKLTCVGAALAASVVAPVTLHLYNVRLREAVRRGRSHAEHVRTLQHENARLGRLLSASSEASATPRVHADLAQLRNEVTALEKLAREQHTAKRAHGGTDASALARNRDPEQGLTRLEYFQNVGQASPARAFQTLVWAILQGDDAALAKTLHLGADSRTRAEAFLSQLDERTRTTSPTPERLAALVLSQAMLEVPALHVTGETMSEPQQATVHIAGPAIEAKLTMQLAPVGWQLVMPEQLLEKFQLNWQQGATAVRNAEH